MVGIQITSRMGEKGQIVIPKPVRDKFSLQTNTELTFETEEDKIIVKRKEEDIVILKQFLNAIKIKRKFPKNIDGDAEYYSPFEK